MQERSSIRLPVGVRDFLPRAAARRRALAEGLLAEFERWGYDRIITPAFEYADVLERGLGDDSRVAAIRFVEPATGEVVALRPDITPQIARVVASRLAPIGGPLRLCYEGAVMRLFAGARGQREVIQAGVELIDAGAPEGDAEAITLARSALAQAGCPDATIDVGHVAPAKSALAAVADPALAAELRGLIAKKDRDGVERRVCQAKLPPRARRLLGALPELYGDPDTVLAQARRLPLDRAARSGLDALERALELSQQEGLSGPTTIDLGELRGFEYYTGMRLAAYVDGVGDAVLRGGRYDDLIARYGRSARAVGFAVDVEALALAEEAEGVVDPALAGFLIVERARLGRAGRIAGALRAAGRRAVCDLGCFSDAEAVAYAAELGAAAVLVLDGRRVYVIGTADPVASVSPAAVAAALGGRAGALLFEVDRIKEAATSPPARGKLRASPAK